MKSSASPGPDGLNAAFFKSAWSWISQDVHDLVTNFYSTIFLHPDLNQTFITLIPKKMQLVVPQDFRPISLCNVIYKLIAKFLAERLKPHLPTYIDHSQAAFIENKHISSNIVITQEIVHSFSLKSWKHHAFMLKLDLTKAFDRLDWNFIAAALACLGLHSNFIRLIRACISMSTSPSLSMVSLLPPSPPIGVFIKVALFPLTFLLLPSMNSPLGSIRP